MRKSEDDSKVWIATQWGGQKIDPSTLVPKGKVKWWEKAIMWIIITALAAGFIWAMIAVII